MSNRTRLLFPLVMLAFFSCFILFQSLAATRNFVADSPVPIEPVLGKAVLESLLPPSNRDPPPPPPLVPPPAASAPPAAPAPPPPITTNVAPITIDAAKYKYNGPHSYFSALEDLTLTRITSTCVEESVLPEKVMTSRFPSQYNANATLSPLFMSVQPCHLLYELKVCQDPNVK